LDFDMAPQVGQVLREARTERGIELSEVERVTKIRVKFLQAMEEDRWEALPAPAYARGFLSIYARFLGLDEKALLDEYTRTVEGADRHEPIPETVIRPGVLRHHRPSWPSINFNLRPVATVLAGVVVVGVLALVIVGSIGESSNGGGGGPKHHRGKSAGSTPATTTAQPASGQVSVELRSTADVWVCLVDDRGRALVNGETLTADEGRGPFNGQGFEVTLGNGSVEMAVDGEPAQIPPVAQPLGYRITPEGVSKLSPSSQPTCL
jgi:cytoskeletal protein RodZ